MTRKFQVCLDQWHPFLTIKVKSHTSDQSYEVVLGDAFDPKQAICECEGYNFRGHCSHQQEALDSICGWVEGEEKQTPRERKRYICPRCKNETMVL